jgi:hypothetical protein
MRDTLPWHIVVPYIPDYGLSTTDDSQVERDMPRAAAIMNELMIQLGFQSGYAAQGGDVGLFSKHNGADVHAMHCISLRVNPYWLCRTVILS